MKNYAVIVAGGSGSRMKSDQPKQFLELNGRPILMHTLDVFDQSNLNITIVLVLPQDHIETWKALIARHDFSVPHQITPGGQTRFISVANGLAQISGPGLVAIHDGARPLVSNEVIARTFDQARINGSGVAAVKVKDSIRQLIDNKNQAVDRNQFYAVQTPQTFDIELIKRAFDKASSDQFTDDASVLEAAGKEIVLVEGSYSNIKITTPEDLHIAQAILESRK